MSVVINGTTGISPVTAAGTSALVDGMTVGRGAGEVATNTAVGASALPVNTTGAYNTGIGYQAMLSNTSGGGNTALGTNSLVLNTTGAGNTAVGALDGASNGPLYSNTTGNYNIAVGTGALRFNTTASNNTAVGYQAGYSNTTGTSNVYMGRSAGYSNTASLNNVFIGAGAGYSTTGGGNTFVGSYGSTSGYGCGYYMTTGNNNTIIGSFTGNQAGLDIRTASNYIVLSDGDGTPRGYFNDSGVFIIPRSAGSSLSNVGVYNETIATGANVYVGSDGYFKRATSSLKYKKNVEDATHGLNDVLSLRSVTYQGASSTDTEQSFGGLIAEEVHAAGLTEFVQYAEDGSPDALNYGNMVALAFKAIQELNAKVDAQAAEIAALKGQA